MSAERSIFEQVYSAIYSHVKACGEFTSATGHEPKSAPRGRISAHQFVDFLGPATGSGLAQTSALMVVMIRIQSPMVTQSGVDADAAEPAILTAAHGLISRLAGDLTLGGLARTIDVRGMSGRRLEGRAGYFDQDRTLYRAFALQVPVIINDAWTEAP